MKKIPLTIIHFEVPPAVPPAPVKPLDPPAPGIPADFFTNRAALLPRQGELSGFQTPAAPAAPADAFPTLEQMRQHLATIPPLSRSALGRDALRRLVHFIPPMQLRVMREMMRASEERDEFVAIALLLDRLVADMPGTYQTRNDGDPVVWLHYFGGGYDCWLIEKDSGSPDDAEQGVPEGQHQAFGYVRWATWPTDAECGYVSLPECFGSMPLLNVDFHFTPRRLSELIASFPENREEDAA